MSKAIKYDKRRYKRHNRIEIMLGRIKDGRPMRYDRYPTAYFSAILLAAPPYLQALIYEFWASGNPYAGQVHETGQQVTQSTRL